MMEYFKSQEAGVTMSRRPVRPRAGGEAHCAPAGPVQSIEPLLQELAEEARALIGANYAGTRIAFDPRWERTLSAVSVAPDWPTGPSPVGKAEERATPHLLYPIPRPMRMTQAEMLSHPAWRSFHPGARDRRPPRGLLAVPLINHAGENFGLIELTNKKIGDFTDEDEQRLVELAKGAVLTLEHTRFFQPSTRETSTLAPVDPTHTLLNDILHALTHAGEPRGVLQTCVEVLHRHLDGAAARFWILEEGTLVLRSAAGEPVASLRGDAQAEPGTPAASGSMHATSSLMSALNRHENTAAAQQGFSSAFCLPLQGTAGLEGALTVLGRLPLSVRVRDLLMSVAQVIALYLQRNRGRGIPQAEGIAADIDAEHAVLALNLDGTIADWSSGAEKMLGYSRRDVLGKPMRILFPHGVWDQVGDLLHQIRRGETYCRSSTPLLRSTGRGIEVNFTAAPVRDAQGVPQLAILVAHEVASVKKLEEQFHQAQKMEVFGHLTGGVAHDFNNLLTVILGYTEILITRFPAGDPTRDLLKEIHRAGSHADALTRQLLAFSRKGVVHLRSLDLNAVVSDTERMLRRLIGEDILMTTLFTPQIWPILADPDQLHQVILNLAINARDAMPGGGRLTIETDNVSVNHPGAGGAANLPPGDYVLLALSDTGIGMTAATRAHIFEPFFTTKGPGKGTGLGLTTVKNILTKSGAHVDVLSEVGQGTTFRIYFPRRHDPANASVGAAASFDLPRGSETVLVVEDEDCVRSLIGQVLKLCGYSVLEAHDGAEALRAVENHANAIDLLVTDVVMPNISGRSLALRLQEALPRLKVLYLSGYTFDELARQGLEEAEIAFLQKPFSTGTLAQKVRSVLDQLA